MSLIFDIENDIYRKHGIDFGSLKHLDAIGLISFENVSGYKRYGFPKKALFHYFGRPTLVEFPNDNDNEVQTGKVLLTKAGLELINICGAQRNQEFYEYAVFEFSKQNLVLSSLIAWLRNEERLPIGSRSCVWIRHFDTKEERLLW